MSHCYRIRAHNPPDTTVAQIRTQVMQVLDQYERELPGQETDIQRVLSGPLSDRPEHLTATHRFNRSVHDKSDVTAAAVSLLDSLPVDWWVLDYHKCPHVDAEDSGCPDWIRLDSAGPVPDGI